MINTGNINFIEKFISPNYLEVHKGKVTGQKFGEQRIIPVADVKTYPSLTLRIDHQIAEGAHKDFWLSTKPTAEQAYFTERISIKWKMEK